MNTNAQIDIRYDLEQNYRYFVTKIFVNGIQKKEILFQSLFPKTDAEFEYCVSHVQPFIRESLVDMGLGQY